MSEDPRALEAAQGLPLPAPKYEQVGWAARHPKEAKNDGVWLWANAEDADSVPVVH